MLRRRALTFPGSRPCLGLRRRARFLAPVQGVHTPRPEKATTRVTPHCYQHRHLLSVTVTASVTTCVPPARSPCTAPASSHSQTRRPLVWSAWPHSNSLLCLFPAGLRLGEGDVSSVAPGQDNPQSDAGSTQTLPLDDQPPESHSEAGGAGLRSCWSRTCTSSGGCSAFKPT